MTALTMVRERSTLSRFIVSDPSTSGEKTTILWLAGNMIFVLLFGFAVLSVEVPVPFSQSVVHSQPVTIHLQQLATPVSAEPEPIVQAKVEEVPVLEPETILSAPVDRPQEKREKPVAVAPRKTVETTAPPVVRRVYGVRKVYAKGLGQGASETPEDHQGA